MVSRDASAKWHRRRDNSRGEWCVLAYLAVDKDLFGQAPGNQPRIQSQPVARHSVVVAGLEAENCYLAEPERAIVSAPANNRIHLSPHAGTSPWVQIRTPK